MRFSARHLVILLLLSACKTQTPATSSDLELLADAHVALMRLKSSTKDSASLRDSSRYASAAEDSLRVYGFTKETFEKEFLLLSDSAPRLKRFNELISDRSRR